MANDRTTKREGRVSATSRRQPLAMSEERAPRERADEGRVDDGLELTQDERDQMLRDEALQNQLPNPPQRAGVHWFWASLTNAYNPVTWYMRLGYKPVKYEELVGWANANMRGKSGEYAGCITVNEMLLMQGSEDSYQRYMRIVHHDKPMEEQRKMSEAFKSVGEEVETQSGHGGLVRDAARPGEISGIPSLERTAKRPGKFE